MLVGVGESRSCPEPLQDGSCRNNEAMNAVVEGISTHRNFSSNEGPAALLTA